MLQSIATPCAMEQNTVSMDVSFPDLILIPFVPLLVLSTALKVSPNSIIDNRKVDALQYLKFPTLFVCACRSVWFNKQHQALYNY